jgi:hypothetical protein
MAGFKPVAVGTRVASCCLHPKSVVWRISLVMRILKTILGLAVLFPTLAHAHATGMGVNGWHDGRTA